MALCVFVKDCFGFNVFPISEIFGDEGCPLFLGEFKRKASARLQESRVMVRNMVEMEFHEPYGVAETEALRPAPVSLTVLVQR